MHTADRGDLGVVPADRGTKPVAHLARLELYRLTLEAKARLEASGLSVRTAAQRLGTSPPQLYRLLDPTNYSKSARQLLALLALGGATVSVAPRPHPKVPA